MRISSMVIFLGLNACVSIPTYVKQFECSTSEKMRLENAVNTCIKSIGTNERYTKALMDRCHELSIRSICTPKDYFKRKLLFLETAPVPCDQANDPAETFVCNRRL